MGFPVFFRFFQFGILSFPFVILIGFMVLTKTYAANRGPHFPSHRFPTDESFHFGLDLGYLSSNSNFVSGTTNQLLTDLSRVSVFRSSLSGEIQPNRRFSAGARLNWDRVTLTNPTQEFRVQKSGLSDNWVFSEYRYFDVPGGSMGFAIVAKIPSYKNPNLIELGSTDPAPSAFLGDGQTDLSLLATQEFWPAQIVRIKLDLGITQRFSGFSNEIPMLFGLGFVTHKIDFDLRFRGNFSLGSKRTTASELSDLNTLRSAFSDSKYALSQSPWNVQIQPSADLWISPSYALNFLYSYSIAGKDSAKFNEFALGITYRWAQKRSNQKKTFQQVDINTDQDAGVFQAESQGREAEPKIVDPNPIKEPDATNEEEFF